MGKKKLKMERKRGERVCVQGITQCLMRFQYRKRVGMECRILRNVALNVYWGHFVDYVMTFIIY